MKERMLAVDVYRGMTIFLMILVNTPGSWSYVYPPLRHAEWHGCTPTDLVFPFFLFISGVSMCFSLSKRKQDTPALMKKIWKRVLIIFLIGLGLNWFPFYHLNIGDLRIMGVLQRIALSYGIAGTLILLFKEKPLIAVSAIILVGYNALLYFTSADPYSLEENFPRVVDLLLLGETHVYGGFGIPFDPEGLLHSFPAAINVVLGFFTGKLILKNVIAKVPGKLLLYGVIAIAIGQVWNLFFPINKPLWTSSYVLYTCGLGMVILAICIYIIDIHKYKKWAYPFQVVGLNPLASYVLSIFFVKIMLRVKIGESSLYGYIYNEVFVPLLGNMNGSLGFAFVYVSFIWLFAFLLYRKGKIIKI